MTFAFNVRIYAYRGMQQLAEWPVPTSLNSLRPMRLNEPYEWAQLLAVNDPNSQNVVFSAPVNPDPLTTMLKIEIPDGQMVQYDINQSITIGSPFMTGTQVIQWSQGWRLALLQAFIPVGLTDDFGPSPGAILTDNSGVILTP